MITIHDLMLSDPVNDAIDFGHPERPVYVRNADGTLSQVDAVETGAITIGMESHTVIVLKAGVA